MTNVPTRTGNRQGARALEASSGETGWLSDRLPPNALDAEQAVLGAALMSAKSCAVVLRELRRDDFYHEGHRKIFDALLAAARQAGDTLGFVAVPEVLRQRGELDAVGGHPYLGTLCEQSPVSIPHLDFYLGPVLEAARLRTQIADLSLALAECYDRATETGEALTADEIATRHVHRLLSHRREAGVGTTTLLAALDGEVRRIEDEREVPTLQFGLPALDRLAGGLEAGEVALICGMPGTGKSVAALMQSLHAARTWGPTALISLEMSAARIARRGLCMVTGFSFHELRRAGRFDTHTGKWRRFNKAELAELNEGYASLYQATADIHIDNESFRLDALVTRLRFLQLEHGIKAAVLDYGQLVKAELGRQASRTDELGYIARSLKNEIAVPLGIPVICLAQPNRNRQQRGKDALLEMGDVYGASEWEAVANMIWFLNRDPKAPKPLPGVTEAEVPVLIEIAKSRDGGRGLVPVTLEGECFRFVARETERDGEEPPECAGGQQRHFAEDY